MATYKSIRSNSGNGLVGPGILGQSFKMPTAALSAAATQRAVTATKPKPMLSIVGKTVPSSYAPGGSVYNSQVPAAARKVAPKKVTTKTDPNADMLAMLSQLAQGLLGGGGSGGGGGSSGYTAVTKLTNPQDLAAVAAYGKPYDDAIKALGGAKKLANKRQLDYDARLKAMYKALAGDADARSIDLGNSNAAAQTAITTQDTDAGKVIDANKTAAETNVANLMKGLGQDAAVAAGTSKFEDTANSAKDALTSSGSNYVKKLIATGAVDKDTMSAYAHGALAEGTRRRADLLANLRDYMNQISTQAAGIKGDKAKALFDARLKILDQLNSTQAAAASSRSSGGGGGSSSSGKSAYFNAMLNLAKFNEQNKKSSSAADIAKARIASNERIANNRLAANVKTPDSGVPTYADIVRNWTQLSASANNKYKDFAAYRDDMSSGLQ